MAEKKEMIMFMVSKQEKGMIKKRAQRLGLNNMSAYLRMLVHDDVRGEEKRERTA